jgi:hypothetical protein
MYTLHALALFEHLLEMITNTTSLCSGEQCQSGESDIAYTKNLDGKSFEHVLLRSRPREVSNTDLPG